MHCVVVIAVCVLALSVIAVDLGPAAGAGSARRAGSAATVQPAGHRVTIAGHADLMRFVSSATRARGRTAVRPQAKKPKKRLKKKLGKKPKKKPKKKRKKKKAASGSGTSRTLLLLVFAAIGAVALFLIGSSMRNTPRARARARDRKRVRKPATP
jgi:hypothetical protein